MISPLHRCRFHFRHHPERLSSRAAQGKKKKLISWFTRMKLGQSSCYVFAVRGWVNRARSSSPPRPQPLRTQLIGSARVGLSRGKTRLFLIKNRGHGCQQYLYTRAFIHGVTWLDKTRNANEIVMTHLERNKSGCVEGSAFPFLWLVCDETTVCRFQFSSRI